jgi:hypothetical protein
MTVNRTSVGRIGHHDVVSHDSAERDRIEGWLAAASVQSGASRQQLLSEMSRRHGATAHVTQRMVTDAAYALAESDDGFRAALSKKDVVDDDGAPAPRLTSNASVADSDDAFRAALAARGGDQ